MFYYELGSFNIFKKKDCVEFNKYFSGRVLSYLQGEAGYHDVIECVESLAKVCTISLCVKLMLLTVLHVERVCA